MNTGTCALQRRRLIRSLVSGLILLLCCPQSAHASIFKGEALDKVANVLTWVVLVVAPVVAITVFLLIHILPEKIAERKHHPQTRAIQCLCLLSLVFGGMLWPLAWLWAYTKPVLHKMAFGTDKAGHKVEEESASTAEEGLELEELRRRVLELEARVNAKPSPQGGKA